ncbi:unnamed protein product [Timema podura]|uniref:Triple QxxK/R motif-containing protein n=1 Tax=Timema podura TaxID=61482 RepID=A0ABN7NPP6_TIMPD|nr:unnamed protein product [Timema podura]
MGHSTACPLIDSRVYEYVTPHQHAAFRQFKQAQRGNPRGRENKRKEASSAQGGKKGKDYADLPSEGLLINCIGIVLVLFATLVIYIVTESRFKRHSRPEDEILLTGNME